MKVFVTNKDTFDTIMQMRGITDANVGEHSKTFFISINDSCGTDEQPYFKEEHANVKTIFFDDIEEDIKHPKYGLIKAFNKEQANELVRFIEANKDKESCIVHCSAGISRSGAVGAFINDYFKGDCHEFKEMNPHILPNGHVLRRLKAAAIETQR